ncbi:MAG TPA: AarF/UbiB family protein [Verrucomicrobiae bacterium]|nr:AarF/UbiB family protein [Verrucomicrobiae bacterium]
MDASLDLKRILLVLGKALKFGLFPFSRYIPFMPHRGVPVARRLRLMIEELGLTYLKLGQFLALRYDILPPEICRELELLFESVPPMDFVQVRAMVETELGGPIERFYSSFPPKPIAAASVAQVHDARTIAGERVAVKVQRAGLIPIFRADIRNLKRLGTLIELVGIAGKLSIRGLFVQFESWTLRELDFRVEAHTAERVLKDAPPWVVIPQVRWDLTTTRVLTMEFIEGMSSADVRQHREEGTLAAVAESLPGFDLPIALHNLAKASLIQLLVVGFFHGDPHPGNIVFLPQNRIAFLDFGIFGELAAEEREGVFGQIENLALGNLVRSFRFYALQVAVTEDTDWESFRRDCLEVLDRWYRALQNPKSPVESRHLAKYTSEMIDVSRRNGLRYDLNYLLFWRALNNLNGALWHIDPNFDMLGELRTFFEEIRPGTLTRIRTMVRDPVWQESLVSLGREGPGKASHVLDEAARGRPRIDVTWSMTPADRLRGRSQARSVGAAIASLSFALLMGVPEISLPWRLIAGALYGGCLAAAFWGRR